MRFFFVLASCTLATIPIATESQDVVLHVEQVMTAQEMKETGVAALDKTQRQAFDAWLNRYTLRILKAATDSQQKSQPMVASPSGRSMCSPTIESTISGEIEGWDG